MGARDRNTVEVCITKGQLMVVMNYRTDDRLADYGFSIEFSSYTGWRVYIAFRPLRQDHDDLALPYQAVDDHGRHYVDWPAKIDSLGDARTVAALWAELIQRKHISTNSRGNDDVDQTPNSVMQLKTDAA